jgi:hypothetical protein
MARAAPNKRKRNRNDQNPSAAQEEIKNPEHRQLIALKMPG